MVSDSVLVDRLREILKVSDLETTTVGSVRRKFEEEFGVDLMTEMLLSGTKSTFLRTHVEETPNDDVQEVEEEEQETENVKEEETDDSCSQEEESESDTGAKEKFRSEKMNGEAKKKGGFNKPCALPPQLQKLVGESELGRPEVVKKIWAYTREKNLQNTQSKRKFLCDEVLSEIFRAKTIDMFQMNKVLSKHIWPIDEEDGTKMIAEECCVYGSFPLTHAANQVKSSVKKKATETRKRRSFRLAKAEREKAQRGRIWFSCSGSVIRCPCQILRYW